MKLAVLSDIHSNHYALSACLEYIEREKADGAVFLGDYISDFPYPQKTLKLLREFSSCHSCCFVKGNREEYMESRHSGEIFFSSGSHQGSLFYTYNNLTQEDLETFGAMPVYRAVEFDGCLPFGISHGGYENSRQQVYVTGGEGRTSAKEFTQTQKHAFHALGHTHRPFIYKENGKILLNPGSVGVPVSGSVNASFGFIEYSCGEWIPQLVEVPYDRSAAEREFHESGLFDLANVWSRTIIANMKTGRHYNRECLQLVSQLSRETGKEFSDEDLWQEAAKRLGI